MLKRLLFLIMLSAMLFVLANTVAHANPLENSPETPIIHQTPPPLQLLLSE